MSEKWKERIKASAACFCVLMLILGPLIASSGMIVSSAHTNYSQQEYSATKNITLPRENDRSKTNKDKPENNQPGTSPAKGTGIDIPTLIAILAVCAYFVQAFIMRSTLVHTSRAYLHVGTWEKHFDLDSSGKIVRWKINARLENTGNTPTKDLRYTSTVIKATSEIPSGYRFNDVGEVYQTVIGPKQYMLLADIIISPSDLTSAKFIYIYGWASYRDMFYFTRRHRTEFCYRIFAYGDPFDKDCSFGFLFHREYNNADSECARQRKIRNAAPTPPVIITGSGVAALGTTLFAPEVSKTESTPKSFKLEIPTIRM